MYVQIIVGLSFRITYSQLQGMTPDGIIASKMAEKYKREKAIWGNDGDRISDYDEVNHYFSNPLVLDTDQGQIVSPVEIVRGPESVIRIGDVDPTQMKVNDFIAVEGAVFEFNSAEITEGTSRILMSLYAALVERENFVIEISGHTDNIGSDVYNRQLSLERAEAVKRFLIDKGIDEDRMKTVGYGSERPAATNATEEGRLQNRRIEVKRIE